MYKMTMSIPHDENWELIWLRLFGQSFAVTYWHSIVPPNRIEIFMKNREEKQLNVFALQIKDLLTDNWKQHFSYKITEDEKEN